MSKRIGLKCKFCNGDMKFNEGFPTDEERGIPIMAECRDCGAVYYDHTTYDEWYTKEEYEKLERWVDVVEH